MKIGNFEVPEVRLVPNCVDDIKKIYDNVQFKQITSKDLADLFGYKNATSGRFYIRLKSLISYGLLQSGNSVTKLGYQMAYPESSYEEDEARRKAIFNVGLWKELYRNIGKNIPADFWIILKNVSNVDAPTAKKSQSIIKKWYAEDIGLLPDSVLVSSLHDVEKDLTARSSAGTIVQSKMLEQQNLINPNNELIQFDKVSLSIPKKDIVKRWNKLQKYMEIYLEDYEEPQEIVTEKHDNNLGYAQCPKCTMVAKDRGEVEKLFGFRSHNGKQSVQSWCIECRTSSNMAN